VPTPTSLWTLKNTFATVWAASGLTLAEFQWCIEAHGVGIMLCDFGSYTLTFKRWGFKWQSGSSPMEFFVVEVFNLCARSTENFIII
jgi:hypothetical protein